MLAMVLLISTHEKNDAKIESANFEINAVLILEHVQFQKSQKLLHVHRVQNFRTHKLQ